MRNLCLAYWLFLTLLLLASNPAAWLGFEETAEGLFDRYQAWSHLLCFTVLSTLVFVARWPIGRGWLVVLLVGYSAGTEVLQWMLPTRRAEWKDFWQDVAGIALGAAVAWICRRLSQRWQGGQPEQAAEEVHVWQRPRRRAAPLAAGPPPD